MNGNNKKQRSKEDKEDIKMKMNGSNKEWRRLKESKNKIGKVECSE
ncbi:9936_t:CDS:2 [Acaulospora morrowiae]|uniref:9936_t:CDS:1 n=1 Tax=Acaulospora morrowiae TaxID=94023 RepID=A0A9N9HX89_9GLOM|nr:9936_t:CDS:2 [Acaulospora morrowiae]